MTALESARKFAINNRTPLESPVSTLARALVNNRNEVVFQGNAIGGITSGNTITVTNPADGVLEDARAAAASGDTIIVYPGSYTVTASLAKNGVNWHFMPGATVTMSSETISTGIWDDEGTAMTFTVSGAGVFRRIQTLDGEGVGARVIRNSHASSIMRIEALEILMESDGDFDASCVDAVAGEVYVNAKKIANTGFAGESYTVWWRNGRMHVHADLISGGAGVGVYSQVNAAPTGDGFVMADEIVATGNVPISQNGSNATAAIWVGCLIVRSGSGQPAVQSGGSNRTYVHAQKLFGTIVANGAGLLYVTADKVSATANGVSGTANLLHVSNASAEVRVRIAHWDRVAFTGESIKITNGSVQILGGDLVAGTANGVEITGGTLRIQGMRIDTSGSATKNPITKSGGTLKVYHSILVAEGTRAPIAAASAQTVSLMGCFSNTALATDADVTNDITGGLIEDSQVA